MTKTNRDPSAEAKIKLSSYLFLSFLRSSLSNLNQMCFLTEVTKLREVCRASTTPVAVSESVIVTEASVSLLQAPIYGHKITFIIVAMRMLAPDFDGSTAELTCLYSSARNIWT